MLQKNTAEFEKSLLDAGYEKKSNYETTFFTGPPVQIKKEPNFKKNTKEKNKEIINNKSNIWFTSDHHFYHTNILKHCNRPHNSIQEMNEDLINKWNEKINKNDDVYYLGDFCFINKLDLWIKLFNQLKGKIHLVRGNHDKEKFTNRLEKIIPKDKLIWVKDYHRQVFKECNNNKDVEITMMHYAMRTWNRSHYGTYMLFGHSHSNLKENESLSMDVGVDTNNFYPYSLDEIIEKMNKKKILCREVKNNECK
jgi:calcineurin-like phosphoesterase family protein